MIHKIGFLHPTEGSIFYSKIEEDKTQTMYIAYSIERRKYGKMSIFPKSTFVFFLKDFYWADPEKKDANKEEIFLAIKQISLFLEKEISDRFCFE